MLSSAVLVKGLEEPGLQEIQAILRPSTYQFDNKRAEVVFSAPSIANFEQLRCVSDFFVIKDFQVPRPAALMNEQFMTQISRLLLSCARMADTSQFRLEMAGRDSSVVKRLRERITRVSTLKEGTKEERTILLRLFRIRQGWRVAVRPRCYPLSVRAYRSANFPGAMNSVAAQCLLRLLKKRNFERVVDLCCGSGTFLAEFKHCVPEKRSEAIIGLDLDREVLSRAQRNLSKDKFSNLVQADSNSAPLANSSCSACIANLPWGERIGKRNQLEALYRGFIETSQRLVRSGGEVLFITQHHEALCSALNSSGAGLKLSSRGNFSQRGFTPHYFIFDRSPQGALR